MKIKPETIIQHLALPYCSFIRNVLDVREDGNSIVHCSQWFPFKETAEACFPNVPYEEIKLGVNFVEIEGPIAPEEDLHVHISMLVGIIVFGNGIIIYNKNGEELRESVVAGDMVFVPRNAPHYFEGVPNIKYSAIEFGPIIDYQKHHYERL